jgi:SAM-dependent methyltransferase
MAATATAIEHRGTSPASVHKETVSRLGIALRNRIGALILARSGVGAMPPQPPTLRARAGAVLVGMVRRSLFWLLPQLDRFHATVVDTAEEMAGALQNLELRLQSIRAGDIEPAVRETHDRLRETHDRLRETHDRLREAQDRIRDLEARLQSQEDELPGRLQDLRNELLARSSPGEPADASRPDGIETLDAGRAAGVLQILRSHAPGGAAAHVLDIGAGEGAWLEVLEDAGLTASGVEPNRASAAVGLAKGLRLVAADPVLYLSSLPAGCMDAATALRQLDGLSLPQTIALLDGMRRILKPGGVALFALRPENAQFAYTLGRLAESRGFGQVDVLCLPPPDEAAAAPDPGGIWTYLVFGRNQLPS